MGKASARRPRRFRDLVIETHERRRFWRDIRNALARDVPPWVGPHDREIHQELRDAAPLSRRAAVWTAALQHLRQYLDTYEHGADVPVEAVEAAERALVDLTHLLDATKDQL